MMFHSVRESSNESRSDFLSWPDLRILYCIMPEGSTVGELAEILRWGVATEFMSDIVAAVAHGYATACPRWGEVPASPVQTG